MAESHKFFRVLDSHKTPCCPVSIPWGMIQPFEANAKMNHDQSLDTLHHRGGLSALEIYAVMTGKRWRVAERLEGMTEADGARWLIQALAKHLTAQAEEDCRCSVSGENVVCHHGRVHNQQDCRHESVLPSGIGPAHCKKCGKET